ncbi:MAG: succinate dehydrogenase cytochrome b subunit [Candidatus Nanopelagicales bacterium]
MARPATTKPPFPPNWVLKVTMAVTGVILVGFVIFHLVGNLKIFLGEEALNHYAHWLQEDLLVPLVPTGWFKWIFRAILLVCFVAHILAAFAVRGRASKARGKFKRSGLKGMANFQARNMLVTGVVLCLFVVFHLLDLTLGVHPAASGEFEHLQPYANVINSFHRPVVSLFYILAMGTLFLHLAHGLWSVVNDLGATGHRLRALVLALSGAVALLIMLGNIAIPFAVMFGWVG